MIFYLLRHGKTRGNLEKRYIGVTDEPLCVQGRAELEEQKNRFRVQRLFVSPLLRCRETADILFPGMKQEIVEDFRECDFGLFENKNYLELSGEPEYQRWIDSQGTLPFPDGESREEFSERCVSAFYRMEEKCLREQTGSAAMVVHGGTIMSIMERVGIPAGSYYDFQVKNGRGFCLRSCKGGYTYDRIC